MRRSLSIEERILKADYQEELAGKTLRYGRLTFFIGIPILILFAAQDIFAFETHKYLFWRFVAAIPTIIFGVLAFSLFKKDKSHVFSVYFVVMLCIVSMMAGIIYTTFTDTDPKLANDYLKSGTTTGFVYALIMAFALSGNTRRFIAFIIGGPILVLCIALYFSGAMGEADWGYLSNIIPVAVVIVLMARIQEKITYKEFKMRKMLEYREEELKEEVARRRKVEEELVEHQEHLEQLVAQRTQELRRTNEELVISKEKAEEMNLLKSHFLNNMSHEIRTPINGILGIAQVLEFEDDIDEVRSYASILKESGDRLYRTLTSILNLSKLESEKAEIYCQDLDIQPILKEEMANLQSQAEGKGLNMVFDPSEKPLIASLDEEMFRQSIYFLIENAIKFTHSGEVKVSCCSTRPKNGTDWISIRIQDTGIGMEQNFMDKLFEPFRQESNGRGRAYEGSGIGLTLTQKFTKLIGGDIRVESEKGVGTTFEILLPERTLVHAV